MWLGIDYYPEHWPEELREEDLGRIVNLGANAIRIGEFAWHLIEPKSGTFDFGFFDRVIEQAKSRGLSVVYGTPTATFPAWLHKLHPDILSQDAEGHKRSFGGRRLYCYNSKVYRDYSLRMVEALVDHYKDESALFMWQVDNEWGHEGSDDCYCSACHGGFQGFLKERYRSIRVLNDIYGTIFWGQSYNDFDEMPMPTPTITTHNPVLKLDWARFKSASILNFAKAQIDCVKQFKGPHQQITHNYYGGYFNRRFDQTELSKNLDVVAFDNYPVWGGLMSPISPAEIAMGHDYMRGLKKQNFWVMEQLIGAQGHDDIGYLPREGESSLWAAQAMARGCESLFYFRYRGYNKGAEQFCQGILDADNSLNDKYREVQTFFKTIKEQQALLATPMKSQLAVLYHYDNRWSWHGQRQSSAFDFTAEVLRCYRPFYAMNLPLDVIDTSWDWSDYKVLILPVMQIVDEVLSMRLKDFVNAGGTVLMSFRCAIKDGHNNVVFGEKAPCFLNAFVGATVKTYEALGEGKSVEIRNQTGQVGQGTVWRDLLCPTTAEALYTYGEPYMDYAACTVNAYGAGKVYYVATGLCESLMDTIAQRIAADAVLPVIFSPYGVEIVKRGTDKDSGYFIMNHTHAAVRFRQMLLEPLEVKYKETLE